MSAALRLAPESVEAVARRVAELLADERPPKLVDAATVAEALGISRATVYERSADLGARRLGDGPRARLRFDLAEAREAWASRTSGAPEREVERPRRRPPVTRPAPAAPLLPIRGRSAA